MEGVEAPGLCTARLCKFDAKELRWTPSCSAAVTVRLLKAGAGGGPARLAIGADEVPLSDVGEVSHLTPDFISLHARGTLGHIGLKCEDEAAGKALAEDLLKRKADYERFEQFDPSSVQSYFQYYAKLGNQQNMLQDQVRTSTYQRAIMENPADFQGATIMDIGAGSGILSFFSAQAGAKTVYAVEASSMAEVVRLLADSNNFKATFHVVNRPLEKIRDEVSEKVDALVSEPIGTFLFNERMIESYLCARDRFLKPGGKMFPNVGNLCIAPFSDAVLHWEQCNKNGFWKNSNFYGLDLQAAAERCSKEHFRQPIVDYINPECLVSKTHITSFDFTTITVESLHEIEIPFDFEITQPCLVHGIAGWFDAVFEGTNATVVLSTAPWCPGTHWYQIRFLLEVPLAVNAGQHIVGTLTMEANNLQSYFVRMTLKIKGTDIVSEARGIDLKDPEYRFYTSQNAYVPPGTASAWGQQASPAAASGVQGQQVAEPSLANGTGQAESYQAQQAAAYCWSQSGASAPGMNGHDCSAMQAAGPQQAYGVNGGLQQATSQPPPQVVGGYRTRSCNATRVSG